MTKHDARFQAEKLIDYVRRGGSRSEWYASKGFGRAHRAQIGHSMIALLAEEQVETGRCDPIHLTGMRFRIPLRPKELREAIAMAQEIIARRQRDAAAKLRGARERGADVATDTERDADSGLFATVFRDRSTDAEIARTPSADSVEGAAKNLIAVLSSVV